MTTIWDVIIVGGGAAGFFGAITAAVELGEGAKVLILEKGRKVLTKVKISGGGRCNVTHDCLDPKQMAREHYPRGNKALIGPFYHFGVAETLRWFEGRGVELKTEEDGRIFPVTDDSQTIINALRGAAEEAGVALQTRAGVEKIQRESNLFRLTVNGSKEYASRALLIATGGTRLSSSNDLCAGLGSKLEPAIASLFTFDIKDRRIEGLQGLSVENTALRIDAANLEAQGPLLITHRGLSGPGVLRSSAWGARQLHALSYRFVLTVNWLPALSAGELTSRLDGLRRREGRRQVLARSPFEPIPKRLWQSLAQAARIPENRRWAELSAEESRRLQAQLRDARFQVDGKSTNKDEFVTCGGVPTDEVDMRTMESRVVPGVYFAGEVLNIDGVTGGFNFQNAWTTGYLAGLAIANRIPPTG